jgi:hypothetical protein
LQLAEHQLVESRLAERQFAEKPTERTFTHTDRFPQELFSPVSCSYLSVEILTLQFVSLKSI